jgi:hypothetical protein
MNHLDDDAELYALGLTDRERDAEIEAHLTSCATCRTRVAAAEEAAASLAAALPPMPAATRSALGAAMPAARAVSAKRAWWPALASAAAVVFAATTAFEGISAHDASSQLARTDVALSAIAGSHFGHTTLSSGPGVVAKALYARDGAWCYVVVSGVPRGAHLVMHRGTTTRDLGALEPGAPATLFVHGAGRVDEIAVVAGDRVVAHGVPAY